jgi:hypothetical protein
MNDMNNDHYIYVVLATCRRDNKTHELEDFKLCKGYETDLCGVYLELRDAEKAAEINNTDDDDIIQPLSPWTNFWDGRKHAEGVHDTFTIQRTYCYKL